MRINKYLKTGFLLFLTGVLGVVGCSDEKQSLVLSVIYKPLDSIQAIEPLGDSIVRPVVYTNTISLKKLPVKAKKEKFIAMLLPSILVAKQHIEQNRRDVLSIRQKLTDSIALTQEEEVFLRMIMKKYQVPVIDSLPKRMQTHPTSIVLAQAAIESGWGTSRFFREGCNVFGIWSFNPQDARMQALNSRESGSQAFLKRYDNISASVEDYFRILGKLHAYRYFRYKRQVTDDPFEILPHLHRYSELGYGYTKKLGKVIRQNNLTQYDRYRIDSTFFIEENWW